MSTFTGQKIANSYKNLLQVNTSNSDLSSTLIAVETGAGNSTPLQLATDKVNVNGTFQIGGVALTANVTALNNIADLSGLTGIIVGDSGTITGRTLTGSSPISISNANGVAGNPTITLATTGITSATYGPLGRFNIDTFGRVISVSVATTVSSNAFVGGTFNGSSLIVENDVSIGGDVVIVGTTNMKAVSATDVTLNNLTVGTKITAETVTATNVNTSVLRATNASITNLTAGSLAFSDTSVNNLNATNFFAVSANATRLFKAGVSVANVTEVAAVSALTKTNLDAITSINTVVTSVNSLAVAVSALSKTNLDAITSINTVVAGVSALTKTNLDAVTSINTVVTNLSATMATSINNRTTAIATNTAAITSINTVVAGVSALTKTNLDAVTSINTVVTNLSATMATSIANVSALTKTNLDAVTSINTVVGNLSSTMATSIATRTAAITSINTVVTNLSATMATSIATRTAAITSINTVVTNLSATMATSIATRTAAITSINTVVGGIGDPIPFAIALG